MSLHEDTEEYCTCGCGYTWAEGRENELEINPSLTLDTVDAYMEKRQAGQIEAAKILGLTDLDVTAFLESLFGEEFVEASDPSELTD